MKLNTILDSGLLKRVIFGLCAGAIFVFVFCLGVYVGSEKANSSFKWADQYHKNFGGPSSGFFGDFMGVDRQFPNGSGLYGQILKINGNVITVKENDGDNTEKIIGVNEKTTILLQRRKINVADLRADQNIIVIGDTNSDGQMGAKLIRVMPAMMKKLTPPIIQQIPAPENNSNNN